MTPIVRQTNGNGNGNGHGRGRGLTDDDVEILLAMLAEYADAYGGDDDVNEDMTVAGLASDLHASLHARGMTPPNLDRIQRIANVFGTAPA